MAGALRLTFEWFDGTIVVREIEPVAKRAPAGDAQLDRAIDRSAGVWLELLDDDGRVAYRRQVGPLFPDSYEIQTGNAEQPFTNSPRRLPYQVQILVPAPEATRARVVLRERRGAAAFRAEARDIVHVDLVLDEGGRPVEPTEGQ